jgi:hypothetical protein
MADLRYTLLADGSSDQALLPILTWMLRQQGVMHAIQPTWADLRRLRSRPRSFVDRILMTLQLYPCDLLCIHRDAEREPHAVRRDEIQRALNDVGRQGQPPLEQELVQVVMARGWRDLPGNTL